MLVTKFDYKSISKKSTEHGRHYLLPDGSSVASVTTILDKTKSAEKVAALHNWRRRVGKDKAAEITTEAAGVGTRMHSYLEDYIKLGAPREAGTNPYSLKAHQMANVVIDNTKGKLTEFWGSEISVYYPGIYAGTTDCIGVWEGEPAIIDFKQTNRPKKTDWVEDYFIQLCAYSEAHNEMFNTDIKRGVILMCSRDLEYQQWVVEGEEFVAWKKQWWNRVEKYYESLL